MAMLVQPHTFLMPIENKCGELSFSTKTEELTLHCAFCCAELKKVSAFIKHLKQQHLEELQKEFSLYDADDEDNKSVISSKKRLRSSRKNIEPIQVEPEIVQVETEGDPLSGTTRALEVLNNSDDDEKLISFESLKFCITEITQIVDAKEEVPHEQHCEFIQPLGNVNCEADSNESRFSMPELETMLNNEQCDSSQSSKSNSNVSNYDGSEDEDYIPKNWKQAHNSLASCKMNKGKLITFELITELEKHPNVWNRAHEDYQLSSAKKTSYELIKEALKVKFPDEDIHDTYVKYKIREMLSIFKKTEKGKPTAGSTKYYERLHFLKGHLLDKPNSKPNAQGFFVCSMCSKECINRSALKDHNRRYHKKYSHVCEICGMIFRRQDLLRQHTQRHLNQRNYKCTMCPKAYYTKGPLQDHMNTHTKTKTEKCEICDKIFYTRANLKQHMKLHSDVKAYPCQICNKPFATSSGRSKHKAIHNKILQA